MRLLKTHSHTSERPGYEARKNAKKVIEGNVDTIRPVSYTHLRAHETLRYLVCRLLLEKKKEVGFEEPHLRFMV